MSISINNAKRQVKRILLTNIYNARDGLSITPLISGRHGIGKSQMMKQIADDLGGRCIVIEGGTLKEGEITGLPYQYKEENGDINFKFLPYYAVKEIQKTERLKAELADLNGEERLRAIKDRKVEIIILFFDEINRTETAVYRELMNILLTRKVNGYEFPWWVQIVGAMNPGSQNSEYAVNEMDPAQLDRFLKLKVDISISEWIGYAKSNDIPSYISKFIMNNPKLLAPEDEGLEDMEDSVPSPRGWEMVSMLLTTEPKLREFFTDEENKQKNVQDDMYGLMSSKLGSEAAAAFFSQTEMSASVLLPEDIFKDDDFNQVKEKISELSTSEQSKFCMQMVEYIDQNSCMLENNSNKEKLKRFIKLLSDTNLVAIVDELRDSVNKILLRGVIDDEISDRMNLDRSLDKAVQSINI